MSFSSASISNPVINTGSTFIAGTPVLGSDVQSNSPTITLTSSAVQLSAQSYSFNLGSGIWLIEINVKINTNDTVDFTGYPFVVYLTDSLTTDTYTQTVNLGGPFLGDPSPVLSQNFMTFDVANPAVPPPADYDSNQPYTVYIYGEYAGADPTAQIFVYCYKLS
jgi:hypothetical protein